MCSHIRNPEWHKKEYVLGSNQENRNHHKLHEGNFIKESGYSDEVEGEETNWRD